MENSEKIFKAKFWERFKIIFCKFWKILYIEKNFESRNIGVLERKKVIPWLPLKKKQKRSPLEVVFWGATYKISVFCVFSKEKCIFRKNIIRVKNILHKISHKSGSSTFPSKMRRNVPTVYWNRYFVCEHRCLRIFFRTSYHTRAVFCEVFFRISLLSNVSPPTLDWTK